MTPDSFTKRLFINVKFKIFNPLIISFAQFALTISEASAAPLEILVGENQTLPRALNVFAYFNTKFDLLFAQGESLI